MWSVMELLVLLFSVSTIGVVCSSDVQSTNGTNFTDANKDMYIIQAMVYQIGIVTNKTDNETSYANATGNEEVLTFYHNNGSNIDLSKIPEPIFTNITAQRFVTVASSTAPDKNSVDNTHANENASEYLAPLQQASTDVLPGISKQTRLSRDVTKNIQESSFSLLETLNNRSATNSQNPLRNANETPTILENKTAVIPQGAIKSIAIPPLIELNSNFSKIPLPIPNTSVTYYSKINTLVHNV